MRCSGLDGFVPPPKSLLSVKKKRIDTDMAREFRQWRGCDRARGHNVRTHCSNVFLYYWSESLLNKRHLFASCLAADLTEHFGSCCLTSSTGITSFCPSVSLSACRLVLEPAPLLLSLGNCTLLELPIPEEEEEVEGGALAVWLPLLRREYDA